VTQFATTTSSRYVGVIITAMIGTQTGGLTVTGVAGTAGLVFIAACRNNAPLLLYLWNNGTIVVADATCIVLHTTFVTDAIDWTGLLPITSTRSYMCSFPSFIISIIKILL